MHPITKKLKKYETKVRDEPVDVRNDAKKTWRQMQKRRYTDIVISRLKLKGMQKRQAHYIIQTINFKSLCSRCSNELIITSLCMYVKFSTSKKEKLDKYSICLENGLTEEIYSAIITRLASHFQSRMPTSHISHV